MVVVLSFTIFLSGYQSDEKQAAKIHKIIEKSAEFENDFVANLTVLYETKKNAQLVYNDLISLDINDKDVINQKIDKANTYTEKQQKLLEEAEENFQKAYKMSVTIEKNINKIKDEDQKNQALELITIMNERKKLIDTFFEDYHEKLELQKIFYGHLEGGKFSFENLNEQINHINERSQDMGEIIQQFNQYTKQYMEVENDYYQMTS